MNLIFLLLVLIFLVLLLDLLLSDGDIFAPPCMLCVIYFICVLLSLYNYEFWSLQAFQSQTVGIIFAALCVFSIVYFCLNFLLYGKRAGKSRKPLTPEECRSRVIPYRAKAFRLTVAFQTLVVAISALTILRLGSGSSWAYILASYKQSMYSGEVSLPEYLEWCNRFCGALGYLYLYIFVNNAVMQRSFRKNLKYLVPVVLHVVRSIVTGNRYNLLAVLAGGVYGFYILYQLRTGWKKTFRMKYLSGAWAAWCWCLPRLWRSSAPQAARTISTPFTISPCTPAAPSSCLTGIWRIPSPRAPSGARRPSAA